MKNIRSVLTFLIGWPLSIIALFFIARLFLSRSINLSLFLHTNWILLLSGIMCFLLYFFFRAYFWQLLLKEKGIEYSFKKTATIWGISELKRYIPGNIWGSLSRTHAYTKNNHDTLVIIRSLVQEMEFLILACLVLSILTINFILFGFMSFPFQTLTSYVWWLVVITAVFLWIFHADIFKKSHNMFLKHLFPYFSYQRMSPLLFIMTVAFLFFGLGTYFSIASVVYLYPVHILSLSGFFVVSFLLGYLSFITPMGLGVREGIITYGLSKYMSFTSAALVSVFARIILVFSELLFVGICIVWNTWKDDAKKYEKFIVDHKYEVILFICIAIYIAYFVTASFLRYDNFFTGRFDLGNMDQTVWNTIRGRFFQFTNPDGTNIISRLAYHADFMLVLLAPFYFIWQSPKMLLVIQTVVLSLGSVFIYLIGRNLFKNKFIAFIFSILFLINPSVNNTNLYDFHAVTLSTTFFLASWYFLMKKKTSLTILLLFIAATAKEELWFSVGLIGLYILFIKKRILPGIITSVASFSIFYILLWHAIPNARGGNHFALSYYTDLGQTQWGVIRTIFLSPWKALGIILKNGSMKFLLEIFAPLGFLSLLSPLYLLFAGGDFAISILSSNAALHNIVYQYTATLTPFIFLSSMYGFVFLTKKIRSMSPSRIAVFFLLIGLGCAYLFGPLPGSLSFNHEMFTDQLPYADIVDSFLSTIPRRYSVSASNNIGSHLSHRQLIYTIPNGIDRADIIVLLLNDQYAQPSLAQQMQLSKRLKKDPTYVELFELDDFVVFKKANVPTYYKKPQTGILPLFKGN